MNKFTIKKQLITDNGRVFSINEDIAFVVFNYKTNHYDSYIGTIKDIISDESLFLTNVEINRKNSDDITIDLLDIVNNSCNYVSK